MPWRKIALLASLAALLGGSFWAGEGDAPWSTMVWRGLWGRSPLALAHLVCEKLGLVMARDSLPKLGKGSLKTKQPLESNCETQASPG